MLLLIPLLALSLSVSAVPHARDYTRYDYHALHLRTSFTPTEVALHLPGCEHRGQIGALADHHLYECPKHHSDLVDEAIKRRRRKRDAAGSHPLDSIRSNQKQVPRQHLVKRSVIPSISQRQNSQAVDDAILKQGQVARDLGIKDPIWAEQWHLINTVEVGNDMNVTEVWKQGITGKNVTVCIIDDGLDMDSDDLKPNYFAAGSWDFNDKVAEPKPRLKDDKHGTRCAGEVSAAMNDACGVGMAYESSISAIRILSGAITDVDEAEAMNYAMDSNDIYSCSWGPPDDGQTMEAPGILIEKALVTGIQQGRQGRGSIFVYAAGNGASNGDDCNFDGYTNSIYSVTVGAVDRRQLHPYYSETCSAQLVVTYSSGDTDAIHTTDVGAHTCTAQHGGTSAAGPLAVGVYALLLQLRPELTWRDIQYLTVITAEQFDTPSDWQETAMNKSYSHQFGYGLLNAGKIVEAAKDWTLVKPQSWYFSPWMHVNHAVPQGDKGIASTFEVIEQELNDANFERVEHITVTMNVEHTRRGDLSVELRSPTGRVSHLSIPRKNDEEAAGYVDWTFMSVAHWGESGIGTWTVIVKDTVENDKTGTFTDWKLRLWGECIDPKKQTLLPMPGEHDDDDHNKTTTAPAHTTSVELPTHVPEPSGNPSDHPERPVNERPSTTPATQTPTASPSTTAPFEAPVTADPTATATASSSATSAPDDSFLPSPFPTFGVSKHTQIWIYGAFSLIVIFCSGLAIYLYLARRRRAANLRDAYEFELVDGHDGDDGRPGANGAAGVGGARKKRRAGELYDAFAGESDEELFSDDEHDHRYRDDDADGHGPHSEKRGVEDYDSDDEAGERSRLT